MAKKRGNNEGSIYKRNNGTWRAMITIDGKRLSFTAKTKVECQRWLRKKLHHLDLGWDYDSGQASLEQYLYDWLNAHKVMLRDHTTYRYKQIISKHIVPLLGEIPLNNLNLAGVERFYATLIEQDTGIRTIREVHAVLHKSLKKAVKYGYIQTNPAHGASLPRYRHAEMQVLDESQVSQFLVAAHESVKQALYHLAVVTGMRQGEIFGLKWADLKWNSGILFVQRQVQRVPGQNWKFIEPKSKAGRRSIKLGEGTLQVLREHRERQKNRKVKAGAVNDN